MRIAYACQHIEIGKVNNVGEKETTNITMRKDLKTVATDAVEQGVFSGVGSLSGLIELALVKLLKTKDIIVTPEPEKVKA